MAPALFKVTEFDNAIKLSVIAAAALLFVVVLRRMTEISERVFVTKSGTKPPVEACRIARCGRDPSCGEEAQHADANAREYIAEIMRPIDRRGSEHSRVQHQNRPAHERYRP